MLAPGESQQQPLLPDELLQARNLLPPPGEIGSSCSCRDGRNGSPLRGPGEAFRITGVSGGWGGSLTEQYNAPDNITVRCNESHCLIRWEQPRTRQPQSNREFQYQLDIQRWVSGLGSEQGSEPQ